MTFEEIFEIPPYSLEKKKKEEALTERLIGLTKFHRKHCPEYGRILDSIGFHEGKCRSYKDLPFLPVRMFKEFAGRCGQNYDLIRNDGTVCEQDIP